MVSEIGKGPDPLEAGIYVIRSVLSSLPLNLISKEIGAKPIVCTWDAARSPTQRWSIELREQGYLIRNVASNHYMSFEATSKVIKTYNNSHLYFSGGKKSPAKKARTYTEIRVLGTDEPIYWKLEPDGSSFTVKPASEPGFVLEVEGSGKNNGAHLIVCDYSHETGNQQFTFERVDELRPHSDISKFYIGSVPPGIYWLARPCEVPKTGNSSVSASCDSPTRLALGVATRLPLKDSEVAKIYLLPIDDGPWPNQVWQLEPGRHGYRLRNLAVDAYLSYVHSNLILESAKDGPLAVTEWVLAHDPKSPPEVFDAKIRPSFDSDHILGIDQSAQFSMLQLKNLRQWDADPKKGSIFNQWRFKHVEEKFLESLIRLK